MSRVKQSTRRQIAGLDAVQLQCRTVGHSWGNPYRVPRTNHHVIVGGIRLRKDCQNGCECVSEAVWTVTGVVVMPWRTKTPEGYKVHGLSPTDGREPFRKETMERIMQPKVRRAPKQQQQQRRKTALRRVA